MWDSERIKGKEERRKEGREWKVVEERDGKTRDIIDVK